MRVDKVFYLIAAAMSVVISVLAVTNGNWIGFFGWANAAMCNWFLAKRSK